MRARDQLAQNLAELPRRMAQERTQNQDRVIAEFDGNLRAMADEILRYRRGLSLLGQGIDWMKSGAPFALLPPGSHWKPPA
jgi:hypothetical protein